MYIFFLIRHSVVRAWFQVRSALNGAAAPPLPQPQPQMKTKDHESQPNRRPKLN
jgi:hypothetical protein